MSPFTSGKPHSFMACSIVTLVLLMAAVHVFVWRLDYDFRPNVFGAVTIEFLI